MLCQLVPQYIEGLQRHNIAVMSGHLATDIARFEPPVVAQSGLDEHASTKLQPKLRHAINVANEHKFDGKEYMAWPSLVWSM